ncbi:MAG: acetyl-CoA hydrolase [Oscillospiraceae bacterium]|nr:acetyl-CoA hydrolase [Oscillospiraceae bacterium]
MTKAVYKQQKPEFNLTRSLIYVNCVREQYRVKLNHWLYYHHIPESISQFGPYVTKYAFYNALPCPPEGEHFGTHKMQLTEHYWLINHLSAPFEVKTYSEYFPPEVLVWQGNLPERALDGADFCGDDARSTGRDGTEDGVTRFIFACVPVSWEVDQKGKGRTIEQGPNYRWQFMVSYPEGVSEEEGDAWLLGQVLPAFQTRGEIRRILTSRIYREVNDFMFHRVVELWFEGPDQWYQCCVVDGKDIPKPAWAQRDAFPYLKSYHNISGIFLADNVTSDNYTMYRGFQTLR